jgi:enamine deaminase RidA (YjgF/YER057c/UK114 family)
VNLSKREKPSTVAWPACVTAGPFLFFSGQLGYTHTGGLANRYAEVRGGSARAATSFDWVSDMEAPVGAQAIAIYERYREMLAQEGSGLDHLLRYHIYQRDKHFFSVFDRIRRDYESKPPASTAVGLGRFDPSGRATLCVDAIALRAAAEKSLGVRSVLPGSERHIAPATFSHVISAGPYLFVAGQIPIDTSKQGAPLIRGYEDIPEEGRFLRVGRSHEDARNGPIAAQTWFTYDLIRRHLEAAGSTLDQILNLVVYLQDIRDFPTFHRVHERFFGPEAPALTVTQSAEVGHKGTLIEIEPTAVIPGRDALRRVLQPPCYRAPAHMSAAVRGGDLAFFSGLVGTGAAGVPVAAASELPARARRYLSTSHGTDPHALQAAAAVAQLAVQLEAAGHSLDVIVHLTVYVDDIERFAAIEKVLAKALGGWRPAITLLEVPAVAPVRGARVSLTAIGWLGQEAPQQAFR